jgi:glucokinase
MGGTKILSAAVNSAQGIFVRQKISTKRFDDQEKYIKELRTAVKRILKDNHLNKSDVKAIALGIPGSVDPYSGRIGLAPNLNIQDFNLKNKLQEVVDYPVVMENDVNLAALGIKQFELSEDDKNVLVVSIGTGIGGALILNDKIYRGSGNFAGEIGHMVLIPGGPQCGCGNYGCAEALASRSAIVRNIEADISIGENSIINMIVSTGERIKSGSLAAAVAKDDPVVIKRLSEGASTIGLLLANVNNLLNLDKIVLSGGVIAALDHYMLPLIKESFTSNSLSDAAKTVSIVATKLGDDAAVLGGIPLVKEFLDVSV